LFNLDRRILALPSPEFMVGGTPRVQRCFRAEKKGEGKRGRLMGTLRTKNKNKRTHIMTPLS